MDDNTIEIRENEINVEEIMAKIRDKIRKKQAAGDLPIFLDSASNAMSKMGNTTRLEDVIQRDLAYINSNWDIHNNSYFITSHHPYIGKFLVKGRQLVHGEVLRFVDPIVSRQTEFNSTNVRIMTLLSQKIAELDCRREMTDAAFCSFKQESDKKINGSIKILKSEFDSRVESETTEFDKKIEFAINEFDAKIKLTTKELDEKIDRKVNSIITRIDNDIHALGWLTHSLEERNQKELAKKNEKNAPNSTGPNETPNYFLFEERFRGSREEIIKRQNAFLQYFRNCSSVLDIGCGRGEFLEILKNNDIGGTGVDTDSDMVAYCRSRNLKVEDSDAIAYLETLQDKSLDGIFIDQVVEHLEPDYLIRLLNLCQRKMKFGYYIVVETVNPLSFVSFVNFYIDLTHKRPVHPETLQYILRAAGFRECEMKFFSPVSEENRLKRIEQTADMTEIISKTVDSYNHNVEMLNTTLFGAQDYAIVGKK